jgi:hypothetical protein
VTATVILRASAPALQLVDGFVRALAEDADVDLVVEGRASRWLLPPATSLLARGGRDALPALALLPVWPKVIAVLLQARRLGRTFACREVVGSPELVIEIRRPPPATPAP